MKYNEKKFRLFLKAVDITDNNILTSYSNKDLKFKIKNTYKILSDIWNEVKSK